MLKLLPSRGGGGEEEVGSTAMCGLIEVCTAVNCRAFKVSFVWNRVQKSEDFGLK